MRKFSLLFIFTILASMLSAQGISQLQQRKLTNALTAISNLYVDTINDKKLIESTLESVLKALDPHSSYIPREEIERINEPLVGSFFGIGIQFQQMEDTILVIQTIAGCPAEKVGVLPGDRIIFIDNVLVAGIKIKTSDVYKKLRGPKGTEVTIKVRRGSKPELMEFKIIRDKIPIYSVDATYMIGKDIGYIKINQFGSSTVQEFEKAFATLQKKGMKSLIVSLQSNGGGYLNAAKMLADEFLSKNKLIVYTQGLNQLKNVETSTASGVFETGKLIFLVDEYSASASEIVSGALQDWDRAIIVGRRTFGKGLVQNQFPLIDGSMMRLTIARYYTPTGRCIQKSYKGGYDKYEHDLMDRFKKGELLHPDSIHFPDSLKYQTLNLKRTVYGGGGIMPDIFVPLDTTRFTVLHRKLVGQGIVNKVCLQYIDKNREDLKKKYTTFDKFRKEFTVDDTFMGQLTTAAEKEKIKIDSTQYAISKPLIKLQLKALVARDLWEINEYYQIMDADNESLQKAVEILQTPGAYEKILK
ncbi:MAG: S41 family peptidase [Paludibacter sp.]